jgi:methylase of polypeptide subunit release factors
MNDKRRTYGQFETPIDVADLLLGFCLRRPGDRVLDPSCGDGALLARAAGMQRWLDPWHDPAATLWGIELDPEAAATARAALPPAQIINRDFFDLQPEPDRIFDAIVGNPPYTRAEWIERLEKEDGYASQLSIFASEAGQGEESISTTRRYPFLGRRAGLHAYFFIHGTGFLREGGRFGFVVPNSWLDVAYGERLKQFLLEHYQILALIESNVERWFDEARVNTCLVILEKCGDPQRRASNRVRLIRLFRPLSELIPYSDNDRQRLSHLERLVGRMLPSADQRGQDLAVRVVSQRELAAGEKWGLTLRAPAVYRRQSQQVNLAPLKQWAEVHRGYTTGANAFFYLNDQEEAEWDLEARYRRPLLKSLRGVNRRQVTAADCDMHVFWSGPDPVPAGTAAAAYIAWGEAQGFHRRRTCAARYPWYALPGQQAAGLLLAKGVWLRHFAPVVAGDIRLDQQLYGLSLADGVPVLAAAALLNCAWTALQLELCGRVNFGEGVLWLAGYEVEELLLPDPYYLGDEQLADLAAAFEPLLDRPLAAMPQEVQTDDWLAYDSAVAAIIGFTAEEAAAVNEGLVERLAARQAKAGKRIELT